MKLGKNRLESLKFCVEHILVKISLFPGINKKRLANPARKTPTSWRVFSLSWVPGFWLLAFGSWLWSLGSLAFGFLGLWLLGFWVVSSLSFDLLTSLSHAIWSHRFFFFFCILSYLSLAYSIPSFPIRSIRIRLILSCISGILSIINLPT